jgi:hypothetical protein
MGEREIKAVMQGLNDVEVRIGTEGGVQRVH